MNYAVNMHQSSLQRACKRLELSCSTYHYQNKKRSGDDEIKAKLSLLADKHKRYGFKKMFNELKQDQFPCNHKKVYRIYCELVLNLR